MIGTFLNLPTPQYLMVIYDQQLEHIKVWPQKLTLFPHPRDLKSSRSDYLYASKLPILQEFIVATTTGSEHQTDPWGASMGKRRKFLQDGQFSTLCCGVMISAPYNRANHQNHSIALCRYYKSPTLSPHTCPMGPFDVRYRGLKRRKLLQEGEGGGVVQI